MKNERIKVNLQFKDNVTGDEEVAIFERIFRILGVFDDDRGLTEEFKHERSKLL